MNKNQKEEVPLFNENGRFPANIILDDDVIIYNEKKDVSKYFYCPKASKKDRDEGLEEFEEGNQANLGISKICSKCGISQRHAYEEENLGKCDHE